MSPNDSQPSSGASPPRSGQAQLPILERRAEIERAIADHRVVVVCGETGSGKTTQLPQICLAMGRGRKGMIGHTQPRRIAARSVAARIAEEMGTRLGGAVGYKVRFAEEASRETRIKVMTDGILLAETQGDPELRAYDTIIIDEAHERSANIDFLLGYLKRLVTRRPELRVIVTSATIDPGRFARFFGDEGDVPVIEVSGRMYPVEVRYRPVGDDEDDFEEVETGAVVEAVMEVGRRGTPGARGDVLVFLPGEKEIRLSAEGLRREGVDAEILPLFSRLTAAEQDRIFHPGTGRQRVILATNVAETSLTVPGIRYVVDTGLARLSRYDHQRRIGRLEIEPISRASADQRAGRCGRVAAGVCVRLYSEESYRARPRFTDPEILRSSLAGVILRMESLGLEGEGGIEEFPLLDRPAPEMIRDGYETLFELGAISEASGKGRLTAVGERLASLPVDVRIGRILLAGVDEECQEEMLVLAACLSIQDPRERPMERQGDADIAQSVFRNERSDFLTLLNLWSKCRTAARGMAHGALRAWCREHFLSFNRMREWEETWRQLRDVVGEQERNAEVDRGNVGPGEEKPDKAELQGTESNPKRENAIHRALMTGLLSNVCSRDDAGGGKFEYRGIRGNRVSIFPGSVLFKKPPRWIVAGEIVQTTRLYARTAAKIEQEWIEELSGHVLERSYSDPHFDRESGEAYAWERATLAGVAIVARRRARLAERDPQGARELFIRHGLVQGEMATDGHGSTRMGEAVPFVAHNRAVMERAKGLEAKLRRRDVVVGEDALVEWFAARIPPTVVGRESLEKWRREAGGRGEQALMLELADVVKSGVASEADQARFPDVLTLAAAEEGEGAVDCALEYRLGPGKETDGVTAVVPLTALPRLSSERAEWLVPGMLEEKIAALLKLLTKQHRGMLERAGGTGTLTELAGQCSEVMRFGEGLLAEALSEAVEALPGVKVPHEAWSFKGLPSHQRLAVRVVDEHGKELAFGRDVDELKQRLAGRLKRAFAGIARARFARDGITHWDFGDLPAAVESDRGGEIVAAYPALVDRGESVSLTLMDSAEVAGASTAEGVRRLLANACREEVEHRLAAVSGGGGGWEEMKRQFKALGSAEELRNSLFLLIVERAFLAGHAGHGGSPVRTREEFERLQQVGWGRLAQATREVVGVVAKILDLRHRIAGRIAGGTPRLWQASIEDMREQAAYLMPRWFLRAAGWEHLREYPRYLETMWGRLAKMREGGAAAETEALHEVLPRWKRFTAWVARAMAEERRREEEEAREGADGGADARAGASCVGRAAPRKAALPQARRAGAVVNVDAGEWAMRPGAMPTEVAEYRWGVEEMRVEAYGAGGGGWAKRLDGMSGEVQGGARR